MVLAYEIPKGKDDFLMIFGKKIRHSSMPPVLWPSLKKFKVYFLKFIYSSSFIQVSMTQNIT